MAVILNASNSSGMIVSSDTSGVTQFQSSGANTVTIDASGNMGVGITSPSGKLHAKAATNQNFIVGSAVSLANAVALSATNDAVNANVPLEIRYASNTAWYDSGTQRMLIDSAGQIYHNASYLLGSSYNSYYAKQTTPINVINTAWTDTGLTWSGVYIPNNVKKVFLWFHLTLRNNGLSSINHSSFRLRVSNGNTIGDASWGFGISQFLNATTSANWCVCSQFVNIFDYDSNGNQASLAAGSTYTFYLQAIDAYGTGSTLRLGSEGNGVHQTYTPQHGMIWVL